MSAEIFEVGRDLTELSDPSVPAVSGTARACTSVSQTESVINVFVYGANHLKHRLALFLKYSFEKKRSVYYPP